MVVTYVSTRFASACTTAIPTIIGSSLDVSGGAKAAVFGPILRQPDHLGPLALEVMFHLSMRPESKLEREEGGAVWECTPCRQTCEDLA